jgi:hypothetical protein
MKKTKQGFHIFASSIADWCAKDDIQAATDYMTKQGYNFSLFYVPVPCDSRYEINFYQPQVEGSIYLGHYKVEATNAK